MSQDSEAVILERAARDGTLDLSEWPRVFENVLQRLHDIVYSEFPLLPQPPIYHVRANSPRGLGAEAAALSASPPPVPASSLESPLSQQEETVASSIPQSVPSSAPDKDNQAHGNGGPIQHTGGDATALPGAPVGSSDPLHLYPELAASFRSSVDLLKTSFTHSPPYTIQRLAELVLYPRKHYRFLPPFLTALDRVVSVSSPTTSFPLNYSPAKTNGIVTTAVLHEQNGDHFAGDEGLGGALLTPIPWLRHAAIHPEEVAARQREGELRTEGSETVQGPHGAGRIETVSVNLGGIPSTTHLGNGHMIIEEELREQGAVTQGELLRQEQEAGVVTVAQTARRLGNSLSAGMGPDMVDPGEEDDRDGNPHVRGPEEIGMEDLGPQHEHLVGAGRPLDLSAALGRSMSTLEQDTKHVAVKHHDQAEQVTQQDTEGDVELEDAE